jgi:hypothetical protein
MLDRLAPLAELVQGQRRVEERPAIARAIVDLVRDREPLLLELDRPQRLAEHVPGTPRA